MNEDHKFILLLKIVALFTDVLKYIFWFCLIYFTLPQSLAQIAGKDTYFYLSFITNFFDNIKLVDKFSIVLIILSLLWAMVERIFRKNKVAELGDIIKKLQIQIDSNRTSSNLNEDGSTNKGDL